MLRLTLDAGFSNALRQKRITTLIEINSLFRGISESQDLTPENLLLLEAAAKEIDNFYNTSNDTQRSVELASQQLANSAVALRERLAEGKTHKGSVRSIFTQIEALSSYLNKVITKELEAKPSSSVKLTLNCKRSS